MIFSEAFKDISRGVAKVKQAGYLERGSYPVIDQGKDSISGYSNGEDGLCIDVPAIIFGDHTRIVKYMDRPFFAGADGVKILKPRLSNNVRYWYHALRAAKLENLGYSRHYKLLKEQYFLNPSEDKQKADCKSLDDVLALKKIASQQLVLLEELVKSRFVEMFGNTADAYTLGSVCTFKSGKSMPKSAEQEDGDYLYAKVGDLNLPGNERFITTSRTRVSAQAAGNSLIPAGAVCFPKRGGAIGTNKKRTIVEDCCLDLNLMAVIPGPKIMSEYLYSYFDMLDLSDISNGSTVPQINNKDLEPLTIPLPPLALQQEFADFVAEVGKSRFVSRSTMQRLIIFPLDAHRKQQA